MSVLFALLILASLVCLIIGLAKPSTFDKVFKKNATRGKLSLIFGGAFILFIILIGVTTPKTETTQETTSNKPENTQPATKDESKVAEVIAPKFFDVPSLIGKNIDQIRTILGAPADGELTEPNQAQLNLGTTKWDNTFKKDGKELLVTFNVKTRIVVDFFISTDDPSGQTQDKTHLLELGNLTASGGAYKIDYVKTIKDPSQLTGATVTPN